MAATSDEALQSLLTDFDQILHDSSEAVVTIQTLQSNIRSEIEKRQVLEFTVSTLKSENERVMKLYTESINKLANQVKYLAMKSMNDVFVHMDLERSSQLSMKQLEHRNNYRILKEELKRVNDDHARKENEFRNAMNLLKHDYDNRIKDLEVQIKDSVAQNAANESTINQLHQDLTAHRNHVEALAKRLDRVHTDVEMKYQYEIQDLKDCLVMEQEEKNGLDKKLKTLEKELLISRSKLAENKQDFSSNRHVETLKQKVMKLRKENEVLKRQLLDSKED